MGYEAALKKAWDAVQDAGVKQQYLKFLNDEYEIDYAEKNIIHSSAIKTNGGLSIPPKEPRASARVGSISMSCNIPAKDFYKLLMLHYIANENRVLRIRRDEWISFKDLDGGEAYFSAFKKRAIDPILRKYGDNPSNIFERARFLSADKIDTGTAGVSINAFPKIKVAVILWAKDDEFPADCNMLFNPEIKDIFPTEDVAVLGGITAALL
ncbi:MAG: DUF3786 domain-containing protein [Candidatus Omnitrophica bacterium]|nr:DUF3786 domain-containing protein [Candidatus Omnitrophota bacterium]